MKKFKKILLPISLSFVFLCGCGGASYESMSDIAYSTNASAPLVKYESVGAGMSMDYAVMEEAKVEESIVEDGFTDIKETSSFEKDNIVEEKEQVSTDRKLIKTVNLSIQTKFFDDFSEGIDELVNKYNGYIESSEIDGVDYYYSYRNRHAYYVARIPQNKLDEFLNNVNDLGTVSYKSENTEDVTLSYYDSKAQKDALEVEQERLMDILEKSETIEQIIALEQRLSEVRYEINSLGSTLRLLDNKVDYSTVYINVDEVEVEVIVEKDKGVFETIKENWEQNIVDLKYFFENLIINMTSNLGTIIFEIILVIGFLVIRKKRNKIKLRILEIKEKREKKENQKTEIIIQKKEKNKEEKESKNQENK